MRQIIDPQFHLGEQDIAAIELDLHSRDDISRILRGLPYIDSDFDLREQVFAILAEVLPERADTTGAVSADTGRPGMPQWRILVLGTLRLGLNADDFSHVLRKPAVTKPEIGGSEVTQSGVQRPA